MRIGLLCSCLEPGRDGVGDYSRRLAEEISRQKSRSALVALHDRYVSNVIQTEENTDRREPPTLRLPSSMAWSHRVRLAAEYLSSFGADRVSLQFVPYGFHEKGINWALESKLKDIIGVRPLHIMFHELWIGAFRDASLKDRIIGGVQRGCVLRMIRRLSPATVTTSNPTYQGLLGKAGIHSELLPLFGNIPITESSDFSWINSELERAAVRAKRGGQDSHWIFAVFGSLHPIWQPEPLFSYIQEAAKSAGKTVVMVAIGRLGVSGEHLWARLCSEYSDAFRFLHLGEQPADRISELLQTADFGIATSPWELVGKSGAVASMIEHGLPVIVNRDDVKFSCANRHESVSSLLVKMDHDLPDRLAHLRRERPAARLPEIARSFMRYLDRANDVSGPILSSLII